MLLHAALSRRPIAISPVATASPVFARLSPAPASPSLVLQPRRPWISLLSPVASAPVSTAPLWLGPGGPLRSAAFARRHHHDHRHDNRQHHQRRQHHSSSHAHSSADTDDRRTLQCASVLFALCGLVGSELHADGDDTGRATGAQSPLKKEAPQSGKQSSAPGSNSYVASSDEQTAELDDLSATLAAVYAEPKLRGAKRTGFWMSVWRVVRRYLNILRYSGRIAYLLYVFSPSLLLLPVVYLRPSLSDTWWETLVHAIERAGPAFIKFGQWASQRGDMFSAEVCQRLGRLRNRAPEHSMSVTDELLMSAFGQTAEQLFSEIDPSPVASGSIAQVYKATLRSNGQTVAVKVRHPWVVRQISTDIMILHWLAREISRFPSLSWMELPVSVREFAGHLARQVNLRVEGENLLRFIKNFADIPRVFFPHPVPNLINEAVLVETFEDGVGISNFMDGKHPACPALAKMGLTTFLKMLLVDNFIHADCHAENILVRFDSSNRPEIVLLDAGLVTELTGRDQHNVSGLFKTLYYRDPNMATDLMTHVSANHVNVDQSLFRADMNALFANIYGASPDSWQMSDALSDFFGVCRKHHIKVESNMAMLAVSCAVLEGLAMHLDPTINMLLVSVPYLFGDSSYGRALRFISDTAGGAATNFLRTETKRTQLKPPISASP